MAGAQRWVMRKTVTTGSGEERLERTATSQSLSDALDGIVGLGAGAAWTNDDGTWEWHDARRCVRVEIRPEAG